MEPDACNNRLRVSLLNKVVFGNPCGTPAFLQRLKFLANQVLGPRFLVKVVPRRGRRTFYLIIYLQLLIFDLKLKSGPESGPLRSEGRHLYSRINSKLTRATALTEWRQLLSE